MKSPISGNDWVLFVELHDLFIQLFVNICLYLFLSLALSLPLPPPSLSLSLSLSRNTLFLFILSFSPSFVWFLRSSLLSLYQLFFVIKCILVYF